MRFGPGLQPSKDLTGAGGPLASWSAHVAGAGCWPGALVSLQSGLFTRLLEFPEDMTSGFTQR